MSVTASFDITGWDETTYDAERVDGVLEGRRDESGARGTLSYALAARS